MSAILNEDFSLKKRLLSEQLQKDNDRVAFLKDSLNRSDNLTENMQKILNSFESRLEKLESTITPVYEETGNLQRKHHNVDKTLSSLDLVISYYHLPEKVEPTIRDGPGVGLHQYLDTLTELKKAVTYFTQNNPGSSEMSQVTALFESGRDSLEREMRNILQRHKRPIPPTALLSQLDLDDDEILTSEPLIEPIPPKALEELQMISHWLHAMQQGSDMTDVYATIRSQSVLQSLQELKSYYKSSSRGSGSMTINQSPGPNKKVKKHGIRNLMFLKKGLKTKGHSDSSGVRRSSLNPTDFTEVDFDVGYYMSALSALVRLLQLEQDLMKDIIPEQHTSNSLQRISKSSLAFLVQEGENFSQSILRASSRQDHQTVLTLFPVAKHLRQIRPEVDVLLEGKQFDSVNLTRLISELNSTGMKILQEFVENIENDPDKPTHMPSDGTVHELSSNTLIFLEQLLEYSETMGEMLTGVTSMAEGKKSSEKPKVKVAEFFTKTLSALGQNLSTKSESYTDATLKSIFLLNNYNYMLKALRKTGLLQFIHKYWNADVESYYESQVLDWKRLYSQSWSQVLVYLNETNFPIVSIKLKDKERQIIKDKFVGLNKELEELHRIQKSYTIPDSELKSSLKIENVEYIAPLYMKFLSSYSRVNFTKNPEKYMKYSVDDLKHLMDEFFSASI